MYALVAMAIYSQQVNGGGPFGIRHHRADTSCLGSLRSSWHSDADALRAEWGALENLEGRLIAPRHTPYGMREFAYVYRTAPHIASAHGSIADHPDRLEAIL